MFTINGSQDPNVYRSFALPAAVQGTLYVRVDDTDHTAGNRSLDSLFVDHLYVRSQPGVPTPPPVAPTALTATTVDSGRIQLMWADQSDNEDGFKIERSRNGVDFTPIATVGVSGTSFEDTGLEASATYYYRVRSFNSGAHSDFSNTAQATTLAGPPLAPSGLIATALSRSEIGLSWSDNSGNETNFVIEQSTDGVTFIFRVQTGANVTSFIDTGLVGNRTYYYRVRASNAQGNSAFSNVGSAKTPKR